MCCVSSSFASSWSLVLCCVVCVVCYRSVVVLWRRRRVVSRRRWRGSRNRSRRALLAPASAYCTVLGVYSAFFCRSWTLRTYIDYLCSRHTAGQPLASAPNAEAPQRIVEGRGGHILSEKVPLVFFCFGVDQADRTVALLLCVALLKCFVKLRNRHTLCAPQVAECGRVTFADRLNACAVILFYY